MSHPASFGSSSTTSSIDERFRALESTVAHTMQQQHKQLVEMMSQLMKPVASTVTQDGSPALIVAVGGGGASGGEEGAAGPGDATAESPVLVAMPVLAPKELPDGSYAAAIAAAKAAESDGVIPFVLPRAEVLPCDNCGQYMCRCMTTKYPRCTETCPGCVDDKSCHNTMADVKRVLLAERESQDRVKAGGVEAIRANVMEGRPSGAAFPPSYDPMCIPIKSVETCVAHITGAPHAGNGKVPESDHAESLFAFFRKHPQQLEGHRDGAHGMIACFYVDLPAESTKQLFMSRSERALESYNCDPRFPQTTHPAQNLWETRDTHTTFREVHLMSHSINLPGKWSPTLMTAMPQVPNAMFDEYIKIRELNDAIDTAANGTRGALAHDTTRSEMKELLTQKPVHVTTTAALTSKDLLAHHHLKGARKARPETAVETLMHQEEAAEVVHADENGFRPWLNQYHTKFWARQFVATSSSSSTESSAGSAAASAVVQYMTNMGHGTNELLPGRSREARQLARFDSRSLAHLVQSAYVTVFGVPMVAPVEVYAGFTSSCFLREQMSYQDQDFQKLLACMAHQMESAAADYGLSDNEPYSSLEIANPECTNQGVVCASSGIAKFIVDVVLPYIRTQCSAQTSEAELQATEKNLRLRLNVSDDVGNLFYRIKDVLYSELKKRDEALELAAAAAAEGSATATTLTTPSGASTSRIGRFFRRQKRSIESLLTLREAQAVVLRVVDNTSLDPKRLKSMGGTDRRLREDLFNSNKSNLVKLVRSATSVTDLCVQLAKATVTAKMDRFRDLNALFGIGRAHTWIDENGALQMFINYVDVVNDCVTMVNDFKWWTTGADLRGGLRVAYEWAENDVPLSQTIDALENELGQLVNVVRQSMGLAATKPFALLQALENKSHPEHAHVLMALKHMSPEKQAWFEPTRFTTVWKIHHTPIWKHVVMCEVSDIAPETDVGGAAANDGLGVGYAVTSPGAASSSSSSEGDLASPGAAPYDDVVPEEFADLFRKLGADKARAKVQAVQAQYPTAIWNDVFTPEARRALVEVHKNMPSA